MIIVMTPEATAETAQQLTERLERMGFHVVVHLDGDRYHLAIVDGLDKNVQPDLFKKLPGVLDVLSFNKKFKLAGRDFKQANTRIALKNCTIGDGGITVIAGPCAIESREQILCTAQAIAAKGATILRGGAFKPRTSPYDFQGLGEQGLKYLREAADHCALSCISEVMSNEHVELVANYVDIVQIGARNMQNFSLLTRVGQCGKPVLLKRGFSATYRDLLMAAEYILSTGNPNVILCERGIRTFETHTRNTLDIAAVLALRELTHLPIVVDPSHGTGIRNMVVPMALAAAAVRADGIMVEVHPDPDRSISDAQQTISFGMFTELSQSLQRLTHALT